MVASLPELSKKDAYVAPCPAQNAPRMRLCSCFLRRPALSCPFLLPLREPVPLLSNLETKKKVAAALRLSNNMQYCLRPKDPKGVPIQVLGWLSIVHADADALANCDAVIAGTMCVTGQCRAGFQHAVALHLPYPLDSPTHTFSIFCRAAAAPSSEASVGSCLGELYNKKTMDRLVTVLQKQLKVRRPHLPCLPLRLLPPPFPPSCDGVALSFWTTVAGVSHNPEGGRGDAGEPAAGRRLQA